MSTPLQCLHGITAGKCPDWRELAVIGLGTPEEECSRCGDGLDLAITSRTPANNHCHQRRTYNPPRSRITSGRASCSKFFQAEGATPGTTWAVIQYPRNVNPRSMRADGGLIGMLFDARLAERFIDHDNGPVQGPACGRKHHPVVHKASVGKPGRRHTAVRRLQVNRGDLAGVSMRRWPTFGSPTVRTPVLIACLRNATNYAAQESESAGGNPPQITTSGQRSTPPGQTNVPSSART